MRLKSASHRHLQSTQTTPIQFHAVSDMVYADDYVQPEPSFSKKDSISYAGSAKKQRSWFPINRLFASKKKSTELTRLSTKSESNMSSSILVNDIPIPTLLNSPTAYLIDETPDTYMDGFPDAMSGAAESYLPVFFQHHLEEVVPWRVLEQHEGSCEAVWIDGNQDGDTVYADSSWLELNMNSSSRMTDWLSKRSESLEIARDLVVRRSKSIRRCWHRNHPTDSGYESDDSSSTSSHSSSARPISSVNATLVLLEAVPEEGVEQIKKF